MRNGDGDGSILLLSRLGHVAPEISRGVPFFGDFLALAGAIGFTPLDFILPIILWNIVRKPGKLRSLFHGTIVVVYTIVGVLGAIGAIRFIVIDSINFDLFVNL